MDKMSFTTPEGDRFEGYFLDSTKLMGRSFYLFSYDESGDGDCFIMEVTEDPAGDFLEFKTVEDEELLDSLASIFGEQFEGADIAY